MSKENFARAIALKNSIKFNGTCNQGTIIGALIKEFPKSKPKDLAILAGKTVKEVNKLSLKKQEQEFNKLNKNVFEKKKEHGFFDSLHFRGKVTTAFPPEPSKYLHIGHAKAVYINYKLAKDKKGIFILRFEDTNPELTKKEFYDIHLKDYEWLGIIPDEVVHASDYMELYYEKAEVLINKGLAYSCNCNKELISEGRRQGKECDCRNKTVKENLKEWKEMPKVKKGSRILRLKIDMEHKNYVMRDPTLFRIIKTKHPLKGNDYKVWPNYDFENSVMDGHQGITHRLRSKEFELRNELQVFIQKNLGYKTTKIFEFARFELKDVVTSGRQIRELVDSGSLRGWDDPRLATLEALRKRGFQPEAIKNFLLSTGLNKTESILTWDDLYLHNRRVLDKTADRYFFIEQPKLITIKNCPETIVKLKKNPNSKTYGRTFKINGKFYINNPDFKNFKKGKLYRLMDAVNFKFDGKNFNYHSDNVEEYKKKGTAIIHWLPKDETVETKILMPSNKLIKGLVEPAALKSDVLQFERFGFCKRNNKEFWYAHK